MIGFYRDRFLSNGMRIEPGVRQKKGKMSSRTFLFDDIKLHKGNH